MSELDEREHEDRPYLVPHNVETRFQFFPGFGWFEVGTVVAAVLLALLLVYILGLITARPARYILLLLLPAAAFFLHKPTPDGNSFYQVLKHLRDFLKSRKRYLYEYRED